MPVVALDSENENLGEMLDELEFIFKPRKMLYVEKRGHHVVTIPRKLTKKEGKRLHEIDEGGDYAEKSKSEPDRGRGEPKESNTQDSCAGNTTQGQSAATEDTPPPPRRHEISGVKAPWY